MALRDCDASDAFSEFSWERVSDGAGRVIELESLGADSCSEAAFSFCQSETSWDVMSMRRESSIASLKSELFQKMPQPTSEQEQQQPSQEDIEAQQLEILELVRRERWNRALGILRATRAPEAVAGASDSDGDTLLSWISYKAKRSQQPALLELLAAVLALCPSHASRRSKLTNFLPLHDAAWGGASPAVATLICAAFPFALDDRGAKETPHEVYHYYHQRNSLYRSFALPAWPARDVMWERALDITKLPNWRSTLEHLILPSSLSNATSLSAQAVSARLDLEAPVAVVVSDFLAVVVTLPSIPEVDYKASRGVNRIGRWRQTQVPAVKRAFRPPCPAPLIPADEVDFLREACVKHTSRFAGFEEGRNIRCGFSAMLTVSVGGSSGSKHHLSIHTVSELHPSSQKHVGAPKWPSKANARRQRAQDRADKWRTLRTDCDALSFWPEN